MKMENRNNNNGTVEIHRNYYITLLEMTKKALQM